MVQEHPDNHGEKKRFSMSNIRLKRRISVTSNIALGRETAYNCDNRSNNSKNESSDAPSSEVSSSRGIDNGL